MPGGLLNIAAYGAENVILTGNPKKHFSMRHIKNIQTLVYRDFALISKVSVH